MLARFSTQRYGSSETELLTETVSLDLRLAPTYELALKALKDTKRSMTHMHTNHALCMSTYVQVPGNTPSKIEGCDIV